MYYKSLKIRLYPTPEQEILMWKHIHASRFIWNYMLSVQKERYAKGEKHLTAFDMNYLLTSLKKQDEYNWLNEISYKTLSTTCSYLHKAYKAFFEKRASLPKFKKRKNSKISFPIESSIGNFYFIKDLVYVQKIGKIKYRTSYNLPQGRKQKFVTPRISYCNGKWILSVGIKCDNQASHHLSGKMGIDLGVKELAIVAYNNQNFIFHNINKTKRVKNLKRKLAYLHKKVSRKYKVNGNYEKTKSILKTEAQIKEICYHISKIRENYIHQITHQLISLYPERIVMEDINISGLMKNKFLSAAIQEQCFYEFIRQIKYKCLRNGIEFIQANRFYPSSKTCSCCGNIKKDLTLSDRVYVCNQCGFTIDRDINAAINLMNYGI